MTSSKIQSLTRQQVRDADKNAVRLLGIPSIVLMENVGRQVADVAQEMLGGLDTKSVAVVAGAGNNGGDGFVAARHLAMRGAKVVTFLLSDESKLAGDAQINFQVIQKLKHDIVIVGENEIGLLAARLRKFDLILDAIGGTGISGPLRGPVALAVEQVNAAKRPVLAVDIPTGLDCDEGIVYGPAVKASVTITFVARKKGFDNPASQIYTGSVKVADIGIPPGAVII